MVSEQLRFNSQRTRNLKSGFKNNIAKKKVSADEMCVAPANMCWNIKLLP